MGSKIIFCAHGLSSRDREVEIPFEFKSMQFYCDLGFKIMHPINSKNKMPISPHLLTEKICKNKLIPTRIKDEENILILNMETELNKLKYIPDENGKIKLNDMLFTLSVKDIQEIILRETIGLYHCNSVGTINKLMNVEDLYLCLERKSKELNIPVLQTKFSYHEIFNLFRDAMARFNIDPSTTEICMFTCRGFDKDKHPPGQTPIAI
jgi:hypothetical protein